MSSLRLSRALAIACLALAGTNVCATQQQATVLDEYADVLNLRGVPGSAHDRSRNVFFDNGTWHGYSLQPAPERRFGFVGPYVLVDGGTWIAERFAELEIVDRASGRSLLTHAAIRSSSLPGRLVQHGEHDGLAIRQTLIFADARSAVVRIELRASRAQRLGVAVRGGGAFGDTSNEASDGEVRTRLAATPLLLRTSLLDAPGSYQVTTTQHEYRFDIGGDIVLAAGEGVSFFLVQTCTIDAGGDSPQLAAPAAAFAANAERWSGYLARVLDSGSLLLAELKYRRVAVKAVATLVANWRSPGGDLRHDGLFPSYSNDDFHGFWAWDSWKHAAALARFAPDLARNQIRAMFDYQDAAGMVADVIYRDSSQNNWRNTKPPLAAWAVWETYAAAGEREFLVEMYPKLLRYHRWWYAQRDHDRDGLAEYGSTDGTRIAAAWESGMDNAVRFDRAAMLRNDEHAWSLNQESVDLNAFLYLEKLRLADIAELVGERGAARGFKREARILRDQIRRRMFDARTGYFYDIAIDSGAPIEVMGPEGWIALWAGVATRQQARAVARALLDPRKFATHMPFPTLAADHPQFSPVKGYWRGPVWIDQASFAVEALRRYGLLQQAQLMQRRLLDRAAGLVGDAPIFENYDPLTGAGVQAPNFSWSAAHYLLLLRR